MRYIQKAVCYCTACEKDIILLESVTYPTQVHQTVDPIYEGWRRFCFEEDNKSYDIFICPKHSIELVLFVDGKKLKDSK